MLNLTEANKALCFQDSVEKPFYVFLYQWVDDYEGVAGGYWTYWKTIQDEEIVAESVEITDGCLDDTEFKFGTYVIPEIKIKRKYHHLNYTNLLAIPVQKIGTQYIAYFYGIVSSDDVSEDKQSATMTMRSLLGYRMDINVTQSQLSGTGASTIGEFAEQIIQLTGKIFIKGELSDLYRAAQMPLNLANVELPQTITIGEFIKVIGEVLGASVRAMDKQIITNVELVNGILVPTGDLAQLLPPIPTIEFFRVGTKKVAMADVTDTTLSLPTGYNRTQYLGCSGGYFNTQIDFSTDIGWKYSFRGEQIDERRPHIMSTEHFYAPQLIYNYATQNNTFFWERCGAEPTTSEIISYMYGISNVTAYIDPSGSEIDINGVRRHFEKGNVTTSNLSFYLATYSGSPADNSFKYFGKIFDMKVYDKQADSTYKTVISYMVPAINSSGTVGMYDLKRNTFYSSETTDKFYAPPIFEKYEADHFITLNSNEKKACLYKALRIVAKVGSLNNVYSETMSGQNKTNVDFTIENNFVFDALALNGSYYLGVILDDLTTYLESLDIRKESLKVPYAPFLESGDFMIVDTSKRNLPNNRTELNSIRYRGQVGTQLDAYILSYNFDFDITFSLQKKSDNVIIFTSGGTNWRQPRIDFSYTNGNLKLAIGVAETIDGEHYGEVREITFPFMPIGQTINLKVKYDGTTLTYSGDLGVGAETFSSEQVFVFGGKNDTTILWLGTPFARGTTDFTINEFIFDCRYTENNVAKVSKCEIVPCFDTNSHIPCIYDMVTEDTSAILGDTNLIEYEPKKVAVPLLAVHSQGIHSMIADISSNINK